MSGYAIVGEWLVEETGRCTCAGGGMGYHEPHCGQEPVYKVAELLANYRAQVARAERAEAERARLDAALTEIHQRAHLMFQRLGGETLRWITERAWRALAYPDAAAAAPSEPQETTP